MSSDEEGEPVPASSREDQEGQRRKKAASQRFEKAIEAWLLEVGGLSRHQFETEEQQVGRRCKKSTPDFLITDANASLRINGVLMRWLEAKCYCLPSQGEKRKKVMEQAQKYVKQGLGPGLVIFSHGFVRYHDEDIAMLAERGWLFVDWQDRPFELQPVSPSFVAEEAGSCHHHLVWQPRFRLTSNVESGLRNRQCWRGFDAVLETVPLKAVRKHVKVKEFVEGVMAAVQAELTQRVKTEQRRLTRIGKKKGSDQLPQQPQPRGGSPPPPALVCSGSHRSSVKRMVKEKLEPRLIATCNLVRHVADDLVVAWREGHRVELKLWLIEALRVFISVKPRANKPSGGPLAREDTPPAPPEVVLTSPISASVAGVASALRLGDGDEEEEEAGGGGGDDGKGRKGRAARKGVWAWEDLERAFRLHAAHLAEDLMLMRTKTTTQQGGGDCNSDGGDMRAAAKQVLLTMPKVRDFLQAYWRAVHGDGSSNSSSSSSSSMDGSGHGSEDRGRGRASEDGRSGGGGIRHHRCLSRSPVGGGGRSSPGIGPRKGSSGSLSSRSISSGSCPSSTRSPRVALTLSPSELDGLRLSQLDEVWTALCGVAQSVGLELDSVVSNKAWLLILEEFRVHKLQSIDRVLRRLNKWMRICTGRISPDSARRRFKGLLKALFKASGTGARAIKYQHFTAAVLGILDSQAYSDDFERWDAVETSLARLLSTENRSDFRRLLMDFVHCKHFTQEEIDADRRAMRRSGSSLGSLGGSGSSKATRKANKTKPSRCRVSKGDVLALAAAAGYHHDDGEGGGEDELASEAGLLPHPPDCSCCAPLSDSNGPAARAALSRHRSHSSSPSLSGGGGGGSREEAAPRPLQRRSSRSSSLQQLVSREDLLDDAADYLHDRRRREEVEADDDEQAECDQPPPPRSLPPPPPPPPAPQRLQMPVPLPALAPIKLGSSAACPAPKPAFSAPRGPVMVPAPQPMKQESGRGKGGVVVEQKEREVAKKKEEVVVEADEDDDEEEVGSSPSDSGDEGEEDDDDDDDDREEEGLIWLGPVGAGEDEEEDDDLVLAGKCGPPNLLLAAEDEDAEDEDSFITCFFLGDELDDEDDHHHPGQRRPPCRVTSSVSDVSSASDDSAPPPHPLLPSCSSSSSSLASLAGIFLSGGGGASALSGSREEDGTIKHDCTAQAGGGTATPIGDAGERSTESDGDDEEEDD